MFNDYCKDTRQEIEAICPECDKKCKYFYVNDKEVLGCEYCIEKVNAWDYSEIKLNKEVGTEPYCITCEDTTDKFYLHNSEIIGCEECIQEVNAYRNYDKYSEYFQKV